MRQLGACGALLISLSSLTGAQSGSTAALGRELAATEQQVWQMELKMAKCYEDRDAICFSSVADEKYIGWSRAQTARPWRAAEMRESVRANLAAAAPGSVTDRRELLGLEVDGDIALVFFRETSTRRDSAGVETRSVARTIHVWKRRADVWKLAGGMSSAEPAK